MTDNIKSHEDLEVYRLSFELAVELHQLSLGFPKIEQYSLADQMRRASKSVCANIAEGFARRAASVAEFKRFLSMAFGSSEEVRVWISFARRFNYLSPEDSDRFIQEYTRVSKMLRALGKSWTARR